MFCGVGDSTLLITRYVRERGDFSLEDATHALTAKQAKLLVFATGHARPFMTDLSQGNKREGFK